MCAETCPQKVNLLDEYLTAFYLGGLSLVEIATRCGVSKQAVEKALKRFDRDAYEAERARRKAENAQLRREADRERKRMERSLEVSGQSYKDLCSGARAGRSKSRSPKDRLRPRPATISTIDLITHYAASVYEYRPGEWDCFNGRWKRRERWVTDVRQPGLPRSFSVPLIGTSYTGSRRGPGAGKRSEERGIAWSGVTRV
ncbi:MAG: hypothetical protein QME76_07050 [Bacillota bacterium]|nr:hypothetical protein [Bacillota bacterium]